MLRSNSKSLGNNVISPEEERERLQWEELNPSRIFSPPSRCGGPSLRQTTSGNGRLLSTAGSGSHIPLPMAVTSYPWRGQKSKCRLIALRRACLRVCTPAYLRNCKSEFHPLLFWLRQTDRLTRTQFHKTHSSRVENHSTACQSALDRAHNGRRRTESVIQTRQTPTRKHSQSEHLR